MNPEPCPNDTDGDGDCGRRTCARCYPQFQPRPDGAPELWPGWEARDEDGSQCELHRTESGYQLSMTAGHFSGYPTINLTRDQVRDLRSALDSTLSTDSSEGYAIPPSEDPTVDPTVVELDPGMSTPEVRKLSALVPLSEEAAVEAGHMATALHVWLNSTPEEQAARLANAAEERRTERVVNGPPRRLDAETIGDLLDRLGISEELAEHMVQPYCTCSIGCDGLDVCQHARDLGLDS